MKPPLRLEAVPLAEILLPDLLDILNEKLRTLITLKAAVAENWHNWTTHGIQTPSGERCRLKYEITSEQEAVMALQVELKRRRDRDKAERGARLHWDWSDRLLAVLTGLCERDGHHALVQEARAIVHAENTAKPLKAAPKEEGGAVE